MLYAETLSDTATVLIWVCVIFFSPWPPSVPSTTWVNHRYTTTMGTDTPTAPPVLLMLLMVRLGWSRRRMRLAAGTEVRGKVRLGSLTTNIYLLFLKVPPPGCIWTWVVWVDWVVCSFSGLPSFTFVCVFLVHRTWWVYKYANTTDTFQWYWISDTQKNFVEPAEKALGHCV